LDRRNFLKTGGQAFFALPCLDPFLGLVPDAALSSLKLVNRARDRLLVVLELAGGNDGLNTVIPIEDPIYHRVRPTLRVEHSELTLGDDSGLALHPNLGGLHELFREGELAIVLGVGYPSPNRSHFRSMDIWQSGRPDLEDAQRGWLGAAAETLGRRGSEVPAMALGGTELPLCLRGKIVVPTLRTLEEYQLFQDDRAGKANSGRKKTLLGLVEEKENDDRLARLIKRTARQAYVGAEKLKNAALSYRTKVEYPRTGLGTRFELAARSLSSPLGTRVVHLRLGGFDTHASQRRTHPALLSELSTAVSAFAKDMKVRKLWKHTAVVCFSEFGRRVAENNSRGTDHGAAAPMFLAGGSVNGGLHGTQPSLEDLDHGDLKFAIDFRRVYRDVLESWLDIPSAEILGGRQAGLELFD